MMKEFNFFKILNQTLKDQGLDRANELASKCIDRARRCIEAVEHWKALTSKSSCDDDAPASPAAPSSSSVGSLTAKPCDLEKVFVQF